MRLGLAMQYAGKMCWRMSVEAIAYWLISVGIGLLPNMTGRSKVRRCFASALADYAKVIAHEPKWREVSNRFDQRLRSRP